MESKTIFKLKDKVYVTSIGWGTVIDAGCSTPNGWVGIESNGRIFSVDTYLVSFTKYNLEGFSQDRPEELPNVGDIVWVRDDDGDDWVISHFMDYKLDKTFPYGTSIDMTKGSRAGWRQMTTINPYKPTKQ